MTTRRLLFLALNLHPLIDVNKSWRDQLMEVDDRKPIDQSILIDSI